MLTADVRAFYGIEKDWALAGFFETEWHRQMMADLRAAILAGRLVAITGSVGVGKTMMLNRLQAELAASKDILVARSLSIDKPRVVLPALLTAIFLDVSGDADVKVPTQPEKRERKLQDLIRKMRKTVVLFIDEAHDLHGNTLTGLKRLMEIVQAGDGLLSVVLVGHPRLRNDLNKATMEEIGHRTTKIMFQGLGDDSRKYLDWVLKQCRTKNTRQGDIIADDALDLMVERLSTPLQFTEHLTRAFTEAYKLGAKPVTREIVEETIAIGYDDLDARLARLGYSAKTLAEQFDTRLPEMRKFLKGHLDSERTQELGQMMRQAGLPI